MSLIITSERERLMRIMGIEPHQIRPTIEGVPWGLNVMYEIPFSKLSPEGLIEVIEHARESLNKTLDAMKTRLENFTEVAKVTMDVRTNSPTRH